MIPPRRLTHIEALQLPAERFLLHDSTAIDWASAPYSPERQRLIVATLHVPNQHSPWTTKDLHNHSDRLSPIPNEGTTTASHLSVMTHELQILTLTIHD
jgi:hypothetical protein